ncbi:GNAT family N-acetyltransferase [Amycolatopsis sp. NPDC049253]|uniref:GNAT family N-acetyltransferase n=1 Tax=Amycolatopsis sp. NPDC049253 TaxID=3155274 RepID=UPI00341F08D0
MPEEHFAELFAALTTDPDCYPYGAWLGDDLVGTALLYHRGDIGQLFSGAVAEHARNRGGQTELVAARARLAAELGCRLLVAETGAEAEGEHNSSLHNLLNLGFQVAYERQHWVWQPAD